MVQVWLFVTACMVHYPTSTERGPTVQTKISEPGPVIAKAKEPFIVQYPTTISDDP